MMKSDARKSLTDLRASLFDIIIFRRKELTTKPRGRAFRRQFLLLSRFACTKAAALFERRGAFSWCKAYVINGFASLLAPRPPPFSSGAVHFLGAKPTQSMALPLCLHQSRRRFQAARRIFLVQSLRNQWLSLFACTKAAAVFERRGAFSWCKAYAINGFASLLAPKPPPISSAGGFGRWGTGYGGGPPACELLLP